MNRRLLIILLSAFALAAGASYVVFLMVGKRLSTTTHTTTTSVIAAARDIKLGSILRSTDLTTVEVVGAAPKGAILKQSDVIGRGAISDIYEGEPILDSRLAPIGSGGGLAATIPEGMRAAAIKVDDVVGVAGFATPGMRVDVLVTGDPPGSSNSKEGSHVATLLQNIEVLSAGTDIQKDTEGKPKQVEVVNLLVTPEQAELLSLASTQTRIQLVLRNPLDVKFAKTTEASTSSLFSDTNVPVKSQSGGIRRVHKPEAQIYLIEVYNGTKHNQEKFAASEAKK